MSGGDGGYQEYGSSVEPEDCPSPLCPFMILVQDFSYGRFLVPSSAITCMLLDALPWFSSSCIDSYQESYLYRPTSSSFTDALLTSFYSVTEVSVDAKPVFFTIDSPLRDFGEAEETFRREIWESGSNVADVSKSK